MQAPRDDQSIAYYDELARSYRLFFQDYETSQADEGRWLDQILRARGAHRVLDACAGTGRQAIPLCEHGYEIVAADPSHAMLRVAAAEARLHGVELPLVQAEFCELNATVGTGYDAVIALGNGLVHGGTREGVMRALEALRQCCTRGGIVLVGVKDFDALLQDRPRLHAHGVIDTDGGRQVLLEVWDYVDPVLECTAILLNEGPDGVSWHGSGPTTREYMVGLQELEAMAREAGFASATKLDHPREAVFALEVPD
jgi:SAM-dependent methyltransferase